MKFETIKTLSPRVGRILIASPFLDGTDFERTVILLITYENGYMGVVVNKPSEWGNSVNQLIDDFKDLPNIPVFNGGVVDKDVLFCMHTNPSIPNSLAIGNGAYVNGDFPDIIKMMKEDKMKARKTRFYLGYAGWSQGQLEQEILQGNWAVANADADFIFSDDIHQMWNTALNSVGEPYCYWAQLPSQPLLN